jgi:DNA-binding XRE family transcriptional regulator
MSHQRDLKQLVIYQKSLDIFKLSRRIASYITYDKDMLSMYKSNNKADRYADSLVMDALGLVPRIVETENQVNPSLKLKYAKSLRLSIDRLYSNSIKLEKTKVQGKEFIMLLRKELKNFKKLHKLYVNSLL